MTAPSPGGVQRWTADGCFLELDGIAMGDMVYATDATRLAACADLLRGQDDLSAVVVMTWADVEAIRRVLDSMDDRIMELLGGDLGCDVLIRHIRGRLPVPPKGDGHVGAAGEVKCRHCATPTDAESGVCERCACPQCGMINHDKSICKMPCE